MKNPTIGVMDDGPDDITRWCYGHEICMCICSRHLEYGQFNMAIWPSTKAMFEICCIYDSRQ